MTTEKPTHSTDHETALRMALGVLADSMESKLEKYVIRLTDEEDDLCGNLHGKWLDVCQNQNGSWYCLWDNRRIGEIFGTREKAKQYLLAHLRSLGLNPSDSILDDGSPHE